MADPTPGISKSVAATGTALVGGAVAKIVLPILAHTWPWLITPATSDAIDDISVAGVVWLATYFTPSSLLSKSSPP